MEEKKKRRSLQKFVFDRKKKTDCFLCNIDEKDEIDKARDEGVQLKDIAEWLIKDVGHDAKFIKLRMKQMTTHLNHHIAKEGKDDWIGQL